jgi:hypothetical protein
MTPPPPTARRARPAGGAGAWAARVAVGALGAASAAWAEPSAEPPVAPVAELAASTPPADAPAAEPPAAPSPPASPAPARKPPVRRREADFLRGDTELTVRLGFNGYTPGPFSLFTSFAGWQELAVAMDHGVSNWKDFTVGVGFEAHYGQAALLAALSQPIANYDDTEFRWSMTDAGGALRGTMHWTKLRGVDPWLMAGLGAGFFHLDTRVRDWPQSAAGELGSAYVRVEAGGGLTWLLGKGDRFVIGAEARYLITVQTNPARQVVMRHDEELAVFSLFPQHKPPKGFSWVFRAGVRF